MRAFLVYDRNKNQNVVVLPEIQRLVRVDQKVLNDFISVHPEFSNWTGEAVKGLPPETFGQIVATREEKGDVCIVDADLWKKLMTLYLGNP